MILIVEGANRAGKSTMISMLQKLAENSGVEYKPHNAARAKVTNFEQKISLCVQLAVLSDEKCKYCLLSRCIMRYSQMYGAKKLQVEL